MQRFDVLGPAHKGLRNALTKLQLKAGTIDYKEIKKVTELYSDIELVWKILDAHAAGEDKFLYPLLEKINKVVFNILEEEHKGLQIVEKAVLKELDGIKKEAGAEKREELGVVFTRNLNDYIAQYLIHLQTEELKAIPELWKSYKDADLMSAVSKFATVTPPDVSMNFLNYLLPAINMREKIGFMQMIKTNAPEPVFKAFITSAEKILPADEFKVLKGKLA